MGDKIKGRSPFAAVRYIALFQQILAQVGAVLAGDASDFGSVLGHKDYET